MKIALSEENDLFKEEKKDQGPELQCSLNVKEDLS